MPSPLMVLIRTYTDPFGVDTVYDYYSDTQFTPNEAEFVACKNIEAGTAMNEDWRIMLPYADQGVLVAITGEDAEADVRNVIVMCFTSPGADGRGRWYVFDRETNSILSVSRKEFFAACRVMGRKSIKYDWKVLQRYVDQGYFKETKLKEIYHPATPLLRPQLENHIQQVTLCCTTMCNLRCSYCAYGGNYEGQRSHGNQVMSLETMKKAIDFFFARSRKVERFAVGFYGGESLLVIDNIKACVAYIREKYKGRKVHYTITTNGTIFNDDIIAFLQDIDARINISLDGPKFLHDANRVYAETGKGSYDDIMDNVAYIKDNYPEFFKKVSFMTTVAPGVDMSCVNEFYNATDVLAERNTRFSLVSNFSSKEDIVFDDLYHITNGFQQTKALLATIGQYDRKKLSVLYPANMDNEHRAYKDLSKGNAMEKSHPGGPCLPGVMRPFVSVSGDIYPCERVIEFATNKIGHIDTGFDMEKIVQVLNVGKLTEEDCLSCWCFVQCGLCVAACTDSESLSKTVKHKNCMFAKSNALHTLRIICLLLESGYDFNEREVRHG